ncbi:MICAL-like protein 1 isoform X2 [Micropterus salmoides]|uniref:MICAL-like protein 1 isoform X2 n=1 Tax=Micropterus salmoides TaxID=27706 RepID=UPI0018EA602A|nr:MICAL-like protein 1 isoform X2 [Micropterus salmoides]
MSDLAQEMATAKALQQWCRLTCACYPDVEIKNMSTSFRDGLAFCAIIHKHRPDLIDFSSLSKDNVYQNNKLAFEIAETKLGIPALLDANDMVSTMVPDCLSVITYLSRYYYFFNRKTYGLASLRSSHVTVLNNRTKSKTPDGLKPQKRSTDLETSREHRLSNAKPQTVCNLCFKPVHLIQRHLIDGKLYHRSCFRCNVCRNTLLPGSYTQGGDACSLICTHHITNSKSSHVDLSQQIGSTQNQPRCKFQAGYFSLGGLAVSSVPHYTTNTESQDRMVCKTTETEGKERQERSREVKKPAPPHLPTPTSVKDRTVKGAGKTGPAPILADGKIQQEATKTQEQSEHSPCAQMTEGGSRPVPAPRRKLDSSIVPVPAPRTRTSQTAEIETHQTRQHFSSLQLSNFDSSSYQNKCVVNSSHITSPTSGSPKVKTNHPWLAIIHPGPWTQLPPAPAPVPTPRSKSVSNLRMSWNAPRVPPPNPFGEDVDEDTQEESTKPEPADQIKASVAAVRSGNGGSLTDKSRDAATGISDVDETGNSVLDVTKAAAGPHATSDEAQSHTLPRSLSVPAFCATFAKCDLTEANKCDQVTPCQSKITCKENPFDRNPAMPKSKTFQSLPSRRAPAPGHGFPLIKRKVQADQNVSTEDLQAEMGELDRHLEALEQRGVELEKNLRDCKNDKEEEKMLMEWFSLIHERHVLVCRDTELVYLTKQQRLEERQADVEYELRCLLIKPESDWSSEDRGREQQLMKELVTIIEQRNQIISSLDQDRQREREEDILLESMMKNKEFQKEGLKELKKSKGKFNPTKVFKMLNHKAEGTKDSKDKKC